MERVWIGLAAGVGLLGLAGIGWISVHSRDLPSVDEAGLRVEVRPPLPAEENAAVALSRAGRLLEWTDGDNAMERVRALRDAALRDPATAHDLVRRNERALDELRRAMQLPELEIPADALLPPDGSLSPFVQWLRLLEIHHVSGALRSATGDPEALEDALLGLRLGARIHRSRAASLPHALLAIALGESALSQLRALVPHVRVDPDRARRLIAAIDEARPDSASWERVWAGEYQQTRALYTEQLTQHLPRWQKTSYVFQPNRTLQRLADLYRGLQRNSGVVCEKREVLHRPRPPGRLELLRVVLAPNSVGNILYETTVPPRGLGRDCELASHASAVQTAIALRAYLDANGALPESLAELVPELLGEVPRDGVRGEPLRYARSERALYLREDGEPWRLGF